MQFLSAEGWPGCAAVTPEPNRFYEENLRKLAHDRLVSAIYDSRINKCCDASGDDPRRTRQLLNQGITLRFEMRDTRSGELVDIHLIRPEELL